VEYACSSSVSFVLALARPLGAELMFGRSLMLGFVLVRSSPLLPHKIPVQRSRRGEDLLPSFEFRTLFGPLLFFPLQPDLIV